MTGERRIPAPRHKVWECLNDPQVLQACIPGCQSLEKTSDSEFRATAAVKIGPISARFTGKVQLTDIRAPEGYTISGEGQGGVAGFAKGGAVVTLAEQGPFTVLSYDVKAQVGGKIAQLGARLVDASAKQMADAFFDRFTAEVSGPEERGADGVLSGGLETLSEVQPGPSAPAAVNMLAMVPKEPYGFPLVAWIGGAIFLVILALVFGVL